jgi:hypothetical protein
MRATERAARAVPPDPALDVWPAARRRVALLATFDRPHFTLVLPDLSVVTVARLERCLDARSRTLRATHRGRSARISPRMSTDLVEGVDEDIVHNS